ncbi:uncharacterized protein LOC118430127 [Branchiostoma floridae]|uniref:Uncharacterized protein LOC118430127 n=1 Tax=Branchiostoma floridae TaxID=7739 RepID=A0A9J7MCM8_BRAFL|nr:uncharacterized protein LOC118430127 [Branchiostoma floridae]
MASKTEGSDMMSPCPEIYLTPPPQPNVKKDGQLTDEQLKLFYDEGFVVVRDFFTPEELQPVRDAIAYLMDDLADRMFQAGLIKNKHENANLFERLILLEKEYPGISVILHKTPKLPQGFRDLWAHDRLLNVMEQLVGPEIAGHPNWNLRPKTPQNQQMDVPWASSENLASHLLDHRKIPSYINLSDNAYFAPELLGTFVGTAWIPFLDVNAENGCMQMVKYGHRKGVTAKHVCCMGGTWYVEMAEGELKNTLGCDPDKDVVTCEINYGSVIFFNNATPHRSLPNISREVRWSLDLRWMDPAKPVGIWGLKDCLPMRSAKNPGLKIDWETFEAVDRNKQQQRSMENEAGAENDFDTTIQGPWMKRWEIVNHNKHTEAFYSAK